MFLKISEIKSPCSSACFTNKEITGRGKNGGLKSFLSIVPVSSNYVNGTSVPLTTTSNKIKIEIIIWENLKTIEQLKQTQVNNDFGKHVNYSIFIAKC